MAKDLEDIDMEFVRRMMSFEALGYKLQCVKKVKIYLPDLVLF
jgi:hypothetical protein